jgi:hypothetical protein
MQYGSQDALERCAFLLRQLAPDKAGLGAFCETLQKLPEWALVWSLELQIDSSAKLIIHGKSAMEVRRLLKKRPDMVANCKQLGRKLADMFVTIASGEGNEKKPFDRAMLNDGLKALLEIRAMGHTGAVFSVLTATLLHVLALPVAVEPDTSPALQRLIKYAKTALGFAFFLRFLAQCDLLTRGSFLAFTDADCKKAMFSGVRSICECAKRGREILASGNLGLRTPDKGPVERCGIAARSWHELAIKMGDKLLLEMLCAADPGKLWALSASPPDVSALDSIDFDGSWPAIAEGISKLPPAEDLQAILLHLECESEAVCPNPHTTTVQGAAHLNEKEQNIVEARAGGKFLTGHELAEAAGYKFNSDFRRKLSELVKRRILSKGATGHKYTTGDLVSDNVTDK